MTEIQELNLQGNPWKCDCNLRDLREKMISRRIPLSFDPKCSGDVSSLNNEGNQKKSESEENDEEEKDNKSNWMRLRNNPWSNLTLDEFACNPKIVIHNTDPIITGYSGL